MISVFALTGCSAEVKIGDTSEETGESEEADPRERDESEIVSEEEGGQADFEGFFDCYADTELADSSVKDKKVEIVMYAETDSPFSINSETHIEKEKNGEDYNAYIITNDVVEEEASKSEATYADGYLYYEYDGGLYKQEYETYDDVRTIVDGYYFKLYEYTVNSIHITNYADGYKKVEFGFDLQNLSEAPDEEIFEILAATATTYKNLSFNEASFVGYISPEGYVSSYVMYYDGQVAAGRDGTNIYTFKYKTSVNYSGFNETEVEVPENPQDYTLIIVDEEEGTY